MRRATNQLPQVAFSVLLALSLRERHGYEIIKQVKEDSNGKISLNPGALYTSIQQLLEQEFIKEVRHQDDVRRRYYQLTKLGNTRLAEELTYFETTVRLGRQRQVLETGFYCA